MDELYGDTKTEEWKQEEINRLNARDGVEMMEEPALNMDGLEVEQGTNKEAGATSTLNGAQITSLNGERGKCDKERSDINCHSNIRYQQRGSRELY